MSFKSMTTLSKNRQYSPYVATLAFEYRGSAFVIQGELFVLAIADIRKMTVGKFSIIRFEVTTLLPLAP